VIVLSKHNNRLILAAADPSDQEAVERSSSPQLGVDWVIAEYDKVLKLIRAAAATTTEGRWKR
jgi:type IV pilus assembly protein PilB